MKTLLTAAIVTVLAASSAHATFSTDFFGGLFLDQNGVALPDANGQIMFAVDINNDGLSALTPDVAFAFESADDQIFIAPQNLNGDSIQGVTGLHGGQSLGLPFNPAAEGKPVYVVWVVSTDTIADAGEWYGTFTMPNGIDPDGGSDWFYPADLTSTTFWGIQPVSFDGSIPDDTLVATEQVVPEPATMALLGLGGLLIARRRKA